MEFLEGETLAARLRRGQLPIGQALAAGIQIAGALAAAHRAGVVHRDLKPANIMLTSSGAMLLDFGLARNAAFIDMGASAAPVRDPLTRTGAILGTVQYMAPEQLEGGAIDHRVDVFAFGAVLFEMVTGHRAFSAANNAAIIGRILHADPKRLSDFGEPAPNRLEALVASCLAKAPSLRPGSIAAVGETLRTIASEPEAGGAGPRTAFGFSPVWQTAVAAVILSAVLSWALWALLPRSTQPAIDEAEPAPVVTSSGSDAVHADTPPLVAVRPFRSLSADSSQAYLAAALTAEVRGHLSRIAGIRLLSEGAVRALGDDTLDAGGRFGISSFVEGTVQRDGDHVRVTVTLTDARTQHTKWGEQYDRLINDVIDMESEVARSVAQAVGAKLSPSERAAIGKKSTTNAEAYQLYLRAKSFETAHPDLLRKALALDPHFAAAEPGSRTPRWQRPRATAARPWTKPSPSRDKRWLMTLTWHSHILCSDPVTA